MKGVGTVYLRGTTWWVRYYHNGQDVRESSKSERRQDAEKLLAARCQEIGRGHFIGPRVERVLMNDLFEGLETDYRNNGRRSLNTLTGRLEPLRAAFGTMRAVDVSGAAVEAYKGRRLTEKTRKGSPVAVATVNRELAALKRAFRLALEQGRLATVPVVKLMAEHNTREGFIEPGAFEALVAHLPEVLADVARFAFTTGWRKGEVLSLEWCDADLDARLVRLRAEHSKNGQPRVIVLSGALLDLMLRRRDARQYQTATGAALASHVFHRQGAPVVDFRSDWSAACEKAGTPGLLFHDLRRSAVRQLEKAGVSQSVAMKISGHKTDSIFRRYRIVDEADIASALEAVQTANAQEPALNVVSMAAARGKRP